MNVDDAKKAMDARLEIYRFAGFNPEVVEWCKENNIVCVCRVAKRRRSYITRTLWVHRSKSCFQASPAVQRG